MNRQFYHFSTWTVAILAVAVAVILYQHASHSAAIVAMLSSGGAGGSDIQADPATTISANPSAYGATSRASGLWTPIGPLGASIFPYQPKQAGP
ncbi:MAG: hypothetical protein P4M15_09505 [Alphaproteobacteria bacterium]|nr:hypothetical protein [Alphaproteobacteria bacterium]